MAKAVQLAFASCTPDLTGRLLDELRALRPGTELLVISEFPVDGARWIPFHPRRRLRDNIALCRAAIGDRPVELAGVVLQPRVPYRKMRLMALGVAPRVVVLFNEEMRHFALHPREAPAILRHAAWRARNVLWWQLRGGGEVRQTWERLRQPAGRRIWYWYWRARLAGAVAGLWKRLLLPERVRQPAAAELEAGISVVIPSRNGRELLKRCLPGVVRDSPEAEIIVVDNGSDDGSAAWLAERYPGVRVEVSETALS
ncbi:MAG: glycosyltransferase, partial [bacterium]|nr:glycosyltransferase [bacterium]